MDQCMSLEFSIALTINAYLVKSTHNRMPSFFNHNINPEGVI